MAFYCAYDTLFKNIDSPTLRFGMALCYSVQPIRDYEVLRAWHKWTGGSRVGSRSFGRLIESGEAPPKKLRGIVEAYKQALTQRREFDLTENEQT